ELGPGPDRCSVVPNPSQQVDWQHTKLRYRIEGTGCGLVKDSGSADDRFFRRGHSLRLNPGSGLYECHFETSDRPLVAFLTAYSGNLSRPHETTEGQLGDLIRTEGSVRFCSFLAVVHKTSGSILTLAESYWTVTRDGIYHPTKKEWVPNDPKRDLIT